MNGGLPAAVRAGVEAALESEGGRPARILEIRSVRGGCIHHAVALETGAGRRFLKWNRGEAGAAFGAEARGLTALRTAASSAAVIRVPEVVAWRDARGEEPGWLLMEYLPPGTPEAGWHRRLGEGLAALHGAGRGRRFGWEEDNRIGSLPQPNPWTGRWPDFWRDARLGVQFQEAFREAALPPPERGWSEAVLDAVEDALAPLGDIEPALLHGDLWSGNVHPGPGGAPVLVDPAVALGHGEVDLAMMELFGGFPRETFSAYFAARPSPPGYAEVRRPLYQLYYLLVHVRLFGGGYVSGARSAGRTVLDALGR